MTHGVTYPSRILVASFLLVVGLVPPTSGEAQSTDVWFVFANGSQMPWTIGVATSRYNEPNWGKVSVPYASDTDAWLAACILDGMNEFFSPDIANGVIVCPSLVLADDIDLGSLIEDLEDIVDDLDDIVDDLPEEGTGSDGVVGGGGGGGGTPGGMAPDGAPLSGDWNSSYGPMVFPPNTSGEFRSPYGTSGHRVFLRRSGAVLEGIWVQDNSSDYCPTQRDGSGYWGRVRFEWNVQRGRYVGQWGYCEQDISRAWDIWR